MLDGAPDVSDVEGVTWYTPQEIEAIRHGYAVRARLDRRGDDLGFKKPPTETLLEVMKRVKQ